MEQVMKDDCKTNFGQKLILEKDTGLENSDVVNLPRCNGNSKTTKVLLIQKEVSINTLKLLIKNCEDISEILHLFDTPSSIEELNDPLTITIIKVECDFADISSREIEDLNRKCVEKSVLIYMFSRNNDKYVLFWKTKESRKLLEMMQYPDLDPKYLIIMYEFVVDFLSKSIQIGHLGLHSNYLVQSITSKVEVYALADSNDYNLLLLAAQSGNTEAANFFLLFGLNPYTSNALISAQSLALAGEHYDLLLMLLKANLPYPEFIDVNRCPQDLKEFATRSLELHAALKNGNSDKVDNILKQNHSKHFFSLKNESAAKIAIKCKKIDMYEKLLVKKITFSPHENITEIMSTLSPDEKAYLREVHLRHSMDLPEKHINTLELNSYIGHEEAIDVDDKICHIRNAFKILNKNPSLRIILMVVAAAKKFRIIFDLNRNSVELADPTVDSQTTGLFYFTGRIYIAAKEISNPLTRHIALSNLIHELCHFAMYLVFQNQAKPYASNDTLAMEEFESISQKCQQQKGNESIVDVIFETYPEDQHHAELIVRVPHMMVFHADNPEKMIESRKDFEPLYDLYEKKIIPAMEKALPEIEARIEKEMARKDKKISKLKKVLFISSLLFSAIITCALYFASQKEGKSYEYDELEDHEKLKLFNFDAVYADTPIALRHLFPVNSTFYKQLGTATIKDILNDKDIAVDLNAKQFSHWINFDWESLPKPLKDQFFNSFFDFQGIKVKILDFYKVYNRTFQFLTSQQIEGVLNNGYMSIGNAYEQVERCVNRNFLKNNYSQSSDITLYDEIVSSIQPGYTFALLDNAGTGKTTTFKHLTENIKVLNPLKWVIFVETEVFENNYLKCEKLDELFGLKTTFDKAVFFEACFLQKTVMLWDCFGTTLAETLDHFYMTYKNSFLFNARTYKSNLQNYFESDNYILNPLAIQEQEDFLRCKLELMNVTYKDVELKKVHNLLTHLNEKSRSSQHTSKITTPLILEIIADEYFIGKNDNLYDFYDRIFDKFLKLWLAKPKSLELNLSVLKSKDNLMKNFVIYALNFEKGLLFYKIHLDIMNLDIMNFDIFKEDSIPEIIPPIYQIGMSNKLNEFAFETFNDYFIAKYLYSSFTDQNFCMCTIEKSVLNIELFFYFMRVYGHNQWLVTEFLRDKILSEYHSGVFCSSVHDAMLNKRTMLVDLLGTDHPEIFQFLFNFFGKNTQLLKVLLKLDEPETLYTSIFNPIYNAYYIDPNVILDLTKQYIHDEDEILKFMTGDDQTECIELGLFFYRNSNVPKIHPLIHSVYQNQSNICSITYSKPLSDSEWIRYTKCSLFLTILINSALDVQDLSKTNETFKSYAGNYDFDTCPMLRDFWQKLKKLPIDLIDFFGKEIQNFMKVSSSNTYFQKSEILKILLTKTEKYLNSSSILHMILAYDLLHKSAENFDNFKVFWKYFNENVKNIEHKKLFLENSIEGFYKNEKYEINGTLDESFTYRLSYFESIRLTPLQIALLSSNNTNYLKYIMRAYKTYFTSKEIIDNLISSEEFIYEFTLFTELNYCEAFSKYLRRNFFDHFDHFLYFINTMNGKYPSMQQLLYSNSHIEKEKCAKSLGYTLTKTKYKSPKQIPYFMSLFCIDPSIVENMKYIDLSKLFNTSNYTYL